MPEAVRVDRAGPVATVILDRPAVRNAVDPATAAACSPSAFQALDRDADVHAIVLWGAGGTFCAGADLKAVAQGWDPTRLRPPDGSTHDAFGPMGPTRMELGKPVIAAVAGHAVAGGLELALWCDLRVAEADATFGVFCRRWGVPLIDGGTVRLPRMVGAGRAMDMILTGRAVGAEEALAMGLANRVVPTASRARPPRSSRGEIAAFPQACLRADRASALAQWSLPPRLRSRVNSRAGSTCCAAASLRAARPGSWPAPDAAANRGHSHFSRNQRSDHADPQPDLRARRRPGALDSRDAGVARRHATARHGAGGIPLMTITGSRGVNLEGVVPDRVNWKSHNYAHLLEQPTIFYATVVILGVVGAGDGVNLQLAWAYVALRIAHSIVQATWNRVAVRFTLFSLATAAMLILAVNAARATL